VKEGSQKRVSGCTRIGGLSRSHRVKSLRSKGGCPGGRAAQPRAWCLSREERCSHPLCFHLLMI